MRVLHVIPYLNRRRGGDVSVCCNISKKLAARGHHVTIATSDFEFEKVLANDIEDSGVVVETFKCVSSIALFLVTPSMSTWLSENLRRFDLVHVHDYRSYQSVIVHRRAIEAGVRYILHPHGSLRRIAGKNRLKFIYDILWGKRILRDAARIIAVSVEEERDAVAMGAERQRTSVIYNGIETDGCPISQQDVDFMKKHSINGRMLLYVGRLHRSKGIDFALRAFAKMADEFEDAVMVICGNDDGYRTKLEELVMELGLGSRVKFLGFIEDSDKISAYSQAHVFFHTVEYMGGVGLAPLESILCGTPVVVTKECSEVVEMTDGGYVVESGDINSLSETFRAILRDHQSAKVKAARGSAFVRERFSWDAVIDRFIEEYNKTVTGSDSD